MTQSAVRVDTTAPAELDAAHSRCLVVAYRYVRDDESQPRSAVSGFDGFQERTPTVSLRQFANQLDHLCRTMEPVDWPTMYGWAKGKGSLPERCFLLTFDDALAEHARGVGTELNRRHLRGAFFVPGAVLTGQRLLDAHAIELLFSTLGDESFERELAGYLSRHVGETVWPNLLNSLRAVQSSLEHAPLDESRRAPVSHSRVPHRSQVNPAPQSQDPTARDPCETSSSDRIHYVLNEALPVELRSQIITALFERHIGSMGRWSRHWYLGWDELTELSAAGHTIGAQGFSNEPLTHLSDWQRRVDVWRVARVLKEGLGPDVRPFVYPGGRTNPSSCAACREAGFGQAFTNDPAWVSSGCDVFRLPRAIPALLPPVV